MGSFELNHHGIKDLSGNVWEWCHDRWDADAYRRRWDGITVSEALELSELYGDRSEDLRRVLRGGSWDYSADYCRSAFRVRLRAGYRVGSLGFRVCLVRSPFPTSASYQQKNAEREQ